MTLDDAKRPFLDESDTDSGPAEATGPGQSVRRIRVLIVDDHQLVRTAIGGLISSQPDMELVGEAPDGVAAFEMVRDHRPDVVLMDFFMPGLSGAQTAKLLKEELQAKCIIGLTYSDPDEKESRELTRAGAVEVHWKGASPGPLLEAIRRCGCQRDT